MNRMASIGTMAAAVAVVLLMCLPVMPAFAAGNSTIVSAESNAVAGEYFSVGICSYTPASGTLPDTFDIFDHTGTMADSEPLGSHPSVYYDAPAPRRTRNIQS